MGELDDCFHARVWLFSFATLVPRPSICGHDEVDRAVLGRRVTFDPDAIEFLHNLHENDRRVVVQSELPRAFVNALLLDNGLRTVVDRVYAPITTRHSAHTLDSVCNEFGVSPGEVAVVTTDENDNTMLLQPSGPGTAFCLRTTVAAHTSVLRRLCALVRSHDRCYRAQWCRSCSRNRRTTDVTNWLEARLQVLHTIAGRAMHGAYEPVDVDDVVQSILLAELEHGRLGWFLAQQPGFWKCRVRWTAPAHLQAQHRCGVRRGPQNLRVWRESEIAE